MLTEGLVASRKITKAELQGVDIQNDSWEEYRKAGPACQGFLDMPLIRYFVAYNILLIIEGHLCPSNP